jgi:hypothetical protein
MTSFWNICSGRVAAGFDQISPYCKVSSGQTV